MGGCAVVIHVCCNLHARIADGVEGQHGHIEIDEVGVVAIDGIEGAVVEVGHKLLRRLCRTILPAPLTMNGAVVPCVVAEVVVLLIEFLRVKTFPPFLRAVGIGLVAVFFRQPPIILHASLLSLQVETS